MHLVKKYSLNFSYEERENNNKLLYEGSGQLNKQVFFFYKNHLHFSQWAVDVPVFIQLIILESDDY